MKKGQMARRLVYYCIGLLTVITVWAVWEKSHTPSTDLSDVLTFVSVVFGGELLLLCVKRCFAKPTSNTETEETDV